MASLAGERQRIAKLLACIWRNGNLAGNGLQSARFRERFDPIFPGNEPAFFTQWNFGATVAEHGVEDTSQPRRNEALAEFSMSYGLPGEPDYKYRRPFDYFNFEFTASSSNIFESIMTRGLLVGNNYSAGETYRGVWGLYGTYDYMAPEVFRVSSTGLSAGTTGQWGLPWPAHFSGLGACRRGIRRRRGTVEGASGTATITMDSPRRGCWQPACFGKFVSLDVRPRVSHHSLCFDQQSRIGKHWPGGRLGDGASVWSPCADSEVPHDSPSRALSGSR